MKRLRGGYRHGASDCCGEAEHTSVGDEGALRNGAPICCPRRGRGTADRLRDKQARLEPIDSFFKAGEYAEYCVKMEFNSGFDVYLRSDYRYRFCRNRNPDAGLTSCPSMWVSSSRLLPKSAYTLTSVETIWYVALVLAVEGRISQSAALVYSSLRPEPTLLLSHDYGPLRRVS